MAEGSAVQEVPPSELDPVVTPWEAHAAEGQDAIDYDKLIRQ